MDRVPARPDTEHRDPVPCVIYGAKSTEDRRGSLETQLADCRSAIAAMGGREIVGEYRDEGASGYTGDRGPGLADAMLQAEDLAARHGGVELHVQHSDRLARGDAKTARHTVEIALWALKANVTVCAIQDPDTFRDLLYAVVTGQRNHEDSARKAKAVAAGLQRAAERGEWTGGILPDGYRVLRSVDDHGRVARRVEFDPDRVEVFRFIWESGVAGWSVESIVLELDRRGAMTRPRRKGLKPRRFDANRVRQTLGTPFYAGLALHRGEIVGAGSWPAYVTPGDFHRAAEERLHRAGRQPGPGRPRREVLDYLLSGIARCSACGQPMDGVTGRGTKNQRQDGTFPRRYVCRGHGREYPRGHTLYCAVKPIDAELVDRAYAENLEHFLGDVGGWRDRLASSRADDRVRLEAEAERAQGDVQEHERVAERLRCRYDALMADGDDVKAEILLETLAARREETERARRRLTAALDALAAVQQEAPVDPMLDFFNRLSAELTGRVGATNGDVRRTNAVLRDFFAAVELTATDDGVRMLPVLSPAATARILEDPALWPHGVTGTVDGRTGDVSRDQAGDLVINTGAITLAELHRLPRPGDDVTLALSVAAPDPVTASRDSTPPLRVLYVENPQSPW
jgi:site-specific DNA recombinase